MSGHQDLDPEGALISPVDERDNHIHAVLPENMDADGNGLTEVAAGPESKPHRHEIKARELVPHQDPGGEYVSSHPGPLIGPAEDPPEGDPTDGRQDLPFQESTTIQSLIFSKDKFTVESAKEWARNNNFGSGKVDEKADTIRLRQKDPTRFKPDSFRTIALKEGIKATIGKLKIGMSDDPDSKDYPEETEAKPVLLESGKFTAVGEIFDAWAIPRSVMEKIMLSEAGPMFGSIPAKALGEMQAMLSLPLAEMGTEWDGDMATTRMRKATGVPEGAGTFDSYFRGFFWRNSEGKEALIGYKFPYADVIGGTLTAVPKGIIAVATALSGSGAAGIPAEDLSKVKAVVSQWYAKMREKFGDESLKPPFEG